MSIKEESTTFSEENMQELITFVLSWLDSQKTEFNQSVKRQLLQEELEDRFHLDMESAYMVADQALNLTSEEIQSLASPGKARTSEVVGKKSIDENLASIPQESTYTPIGKKPILTLNFQHDYYKLKNDEFTTIRGKGLYYKNFTVNGQERKLQKGDIIRTTKYKDFFSDTVLANIELKRIENIPLEVLQRDGEYPDFTINSIEDFVDLINSFLPKHYSKATPESYKTLLSLKKTLTADPRVNENLASSVGKNDIQEEPRQESLASHPIIADPEGKNIGKIMSLVNVDKSLASEFNPGSGEPTYKVVKKGTEFYISANIQGLVKKFKTCGKKGCRCLNGKEHGPYYYLYIKDPNTGKRREIYFGRAPA